MSRFHALRGVFALCLSIAAFTASAEEAICTAPGVTVLTDNAGDVQPGIAMGAVPMALPLDYADLLSLQVGQMADDKLMFTLSVTSLETLPTLPPSSIWYVSFKTAAGLYGVRMVTSQSGAASFESYQVDTGGLEGDGASDGRFAVTGSEKAADAQSQFTDGAITIVVPMADVGVQRAGETLSQFNAAQIVLVNTPAVLFADTFDQMPDDLGRRGSLNLDAASCSGAAKAGVTGSVSNRFGGGAFGWALMLPLLLVRLVRRRG